MLQPADPFALEDIRRAAENLRTDVAAFFGELPPAVFFARPSAGWSPAENVKHLVKVGLAVNLGLLTPRPMLAVFGRARASRPLSEIKDDYLGRLRAGASAAVIYRPLPTPAPAGAVETARARTLIDKFVRVGQAFEAALGTWTEEALDRYAMPHPIMGRVPVREMCLFNLLHTTHHLGIVKGRLAGPL